MIEIWLIEDDVAFRRTMRYVIDHSEGLRCGEAFGSVEEAVELLRAYEGRVRPFAMPAVVLMDVNLPGKSGLEGLGTLKALLPQSRFVMLTIRDDADTIYQALGDGASGYLVKNAGVDQIVAAVREAAAGGMLMPPAVARKVQTFFRERAPAADNPYDLTEREREVLREMTAGYGKQQIARRLHVSTNTVGTHIRHIYDKLHVHSGLAAVAKAVRERLV